MKNDPTTKKDPAGIGSLVAGFLGVGMALYYRSKVPIAYQPESFRTLLVAGGAAFALALRASLRRRPRSPDSLNRTAMITIGGLGYSVWIFLERSPQVLAPLLAALGGGLVGNSLPFLIREWPWWKRG